MKDSFKSYIDILNPITHPKTVNSLINEVHLKFRFEQIMLNRLKSKNNIKDENIFKNPWNNKYPRKKILEIKNAMFNDTEFLEDRKYFIKSNVDLINDSVKNSLEHLNQPTKSYEKDIMYKDLDPIERAAKIYEEKQESLERLGIGLNPAKNSSFEKKRKDTSNISQHSELRNMNNINNVNQSAPNLKKVQFKMKVYNNNKERERLFNKVKNPNENERERLVNKKLDFVNSVDKKKIHAKYNKCKLDINRLNIENFETTLELEQSNMLYDEKVPTNNLPSLTQPAETAETESDKERNTSILKKIEKEYFLMKIDDKIEFIKKRIIPSSRIHNDKTNMKPMEQKNETILNAGKAVGKIKLKDLLKKTELRKMDQSFPSKKDRVNTAAKKKYLLPCEKKICLKHASEEKKEMKLKDASGRTKEMNKRKMEKFAVSINQGVEQIFNYNEKIDKIFERSEADILQMKGKDLYL